MHTIFTVPSLSLLCFVADFLWWHPQEYSGRKECRPAHCIGKATWLQMGSDGFVKKTLMVQSYFNFNIGFHVIIRRALRSEQREQILPLKVFTTLEKLCLRYGKKKMQRAPKMLCVQEQQLRLLKLLSLLKPWSHWMSEWRRLLPVKNSFVCNNLVGVCIQQTQIKPMASVWENKLQVANVDCHGDGADCHGHQILPPSKSNFSKI